MTTTTDTMTTTTGGRIVRAYAVSVSMAGYLPNDGAVALYADAYDAVRDAVDTLRRDADDVWSLHDDDADMARDAAAPYDDAASALAASADAVAAHLLTAPMDYGHDVIVRSVYGPTMVYRVAVVAACCPSVVDGRGHDGAPWSCD